MKWLDIAWEQEGAGVEEIGGPQASKSVIAYFHSINATSAFTGGNVSWRVVARI